MDMFINKKWPINQFGPFEKLRIFIVNLNSTLQKGWDVNQPKVQLYVQIIT